MIQLELILPDKSGCEVFSEMRMIRLAVTTALMSGYNEQDATQDIVGRGLAGFIAKPFRIADLLAKIDEVLAVSSA